MRTVEQYIGAITSLIFFQCQVEEEAYQQKVDKYQEVESFNRPNPSGGRRWGTAPRCIPVAGSQPPRNNRKLRHNDLGIAHMLSVILKVLSQQHCRQAMQFNRNSDVFLKSPLNQYSNLGSVIRNPKSARCDTRRTDLRRKERNIPTHLVHVAIHLHIFKMEIKITRGEDLHSKLLVGILSTATPKDVRVKD